MRLRTAVNKPSRYEEDHNVCSQTRSSDCSKINKSTLPAFPALLGTSTTQIDRKRWPAAFPSLPLGRKPSNVKKDFEHSVSAGSEAPSQESRSSSLPLTLRRLHSQEEDYAAIDTAPGDTEMTCSGSFEPDPVDNGHTRPMQLPGDVSEVLGISEISWTRMKPGLQLYIYDSLLQQYQQPHLVAKVLQLEPSQLRAILHTKSQRALHPATTEELWDHCRRLGNGTHSFVEPQILQNYLDYFAYISKFEHANTSDHYAALVFLRQRKIEGAFVEALLPKQTGIWIRPDFTGMRQSDQAPERGRSQDDVAQPPLSLVVNSIGGSPFESLAGSLEAKLNDPRQVHLMRHAKVNTPTRLKIYHSRLEKMPLGYQHKSSALENAKRRRELEMAKLLNIVRSGVSRNKSSTLPSHTSTSAIHAQAISSTDSSTRQSADTCSSSSGLDRPSSPATEQGYSSATTQESGITSDHAMDDMPILERKVDRYRSETLSTNATLILPNPESRYQALHTRMEHRRDIRYGQHPPHYILDLVEQLDPPAPPSTSLGTDAATMQPHHDTRTTPSPPPWSPITDGCGEIHEADGTSVQVPVRATIEFAASQDTDSVYLRELPLKHKNTISPAPCTASETLPKPEPDAGEVAVSKNSIVGLPKITIDIARVSAVVGSQQDLTNRPDQVVLEHSSITNAAEPPTGSESLPEPVIDPSEGGRQFGILVGIHEATASPSSSESQSSDTRALPKCTSHQATLPSAPRVTHPSESSSPSHSPKKKKHKHTTTPLPRTQHSIHSMKPSLKFEVPKSSSQKSSPKSSTSSPKKIRSDKGKKRAPYVTRRMKLATANGEGTGI